MGARFHDGARRSRLVDREAARRRRGLDGQRAGVTRIAPRCQHSQMPPLSQMGVDLDFSSFSAWGVEVKDTGLLVVLRVALCGPVWSLLAMLVFELVALVRHVIVAQDV